MSNKLRLFGLGASKDFAEQVAAHVGPEGALCNHVETLFDDNECYVRSNVNVRGCDVFVIQSLYGCTKETLHDKLCKLLFFIGSLKDASAERVTAVIPYMCYGRQDRKTESRAPIMSKYVKYLLQSVGVDRILTMDVHNLAAFQCAFDVPTDHLEAKNLIARYIADNCAEPKRLAVLSPDAGGIPRARYFRNKLSQYLNVDIDLPVMDKEHAGRTIKGHKITGDVNGKLIVVYDDMISSAKTMYESLKAVEENGGEVWGIAATHGLFVGKANEYLKDVKRIIVTDTVHPFRLHPAIAVNLKVISTAKLFAQAIRRIHEEDSISDLLT
jgi:ribose-phosphate pyrophosphokinase